MMAKERILRPTDIIYDLVEEIVPAALPAAGEQKVSPAGSSGPQRTWPPGAHIYDLLDAVAEGGEVPTGGGEMTEAVLKIVRETAEKMARELIPDIAERIIREEIDKLKQDHSA